MSGFVAFDIETDGLFEGDVRPNITCVVTMQMRELSPGSFVMGRARCWHEELESGEFMSKKTLVDLVRYLSDCMQDGLLPISWNGVGFDFRVLHAHAQEHSLLTEAAQIRTLALNGVDPMFNFFMHKGFPIGLKRVASGFKLALNKTGSGEDAIDAWEQGGPQGRLGVVNYCENDVTVLCMVVSAISSRHRITWITRSQNRPAEWQPVVRSKCLMKTRHAMCLTPPDNKWMHRNKGPNLPRLRKNDFTGWLGKHK
jgi:hypothetical protein